MMENGMIAIALSKELKTIAEKVEAGERLSFEEAAPFRSRLVNQLRKETARLDELLMIVALRRV